MPLTVDTGKEAELTPRHLWQRSKGTGCVPKAMPLTISLCARNRTPRLPASRATVAANLTVLPEACPTPRPTRRMSLHAHRAALSAARVDSAAKRALCERKKPVRQTGRTDVGRPYVARNRPAVGLEASEKGLTIPAFLHKCRGDLARSGKGGSGPRYPCLLYTSPSPRDGLLSRMPSSA